MRPDQRELDDEIQGHLALSIKERIERGEDPKAARRAALQEFGYIPDARESMRRVWYSRWFDTAGNFIQDVRIGFRSLLRAKGLSVAVIVTLALGIGANAAIFSVVRGVLLRPLVNRDENRLVYIRQSAPGFGTDNMTFSVPEIADFKSRVSSIGAFGDFSVVEFTMLGLGDPRVVRAGVVSGSYFDVMGLRPVLGRLLDAGDDGPDAASVAVLTYGFWTTWLKGDPSVVGKQIRLGIRNTIVVGVLEPSVPYPTATEIIANVVTSPHHLDATMRTGRTHRMTELFGRLAPDATVESARTELTAVHAALMHEHPEAYSAKADVRLAVTPLRDQITAPARTILILLLAAAAVVFVIACSNVANLLLARSVRREGELTVRAALGASHGALRRTLLAESLVLCGAGALLGLAVARPLVAVVARFASRFSVRALDVTVDPSVLWVGAGLAIIAAVVLAYVPRLPTTYAATGFGLTAPRGTGGGLSGLRITPGNNRRLRVFATIQIAFSFVLLAGAGALIATLMAMRTAPTGYEMRQVLVLDVPPSVVGASREPTIKFVREATRRVRELPGVQGVATSSFAPWRDARGSTFPHFQFAVEGYTPANGDENPHGRLRIVSPNFFAVLGVPLIAGRDFTDADDGKTPVAIVSQSVALRLFPNGDILNRQFRWTDPLFREMHPCRIVGVVADVDDEHVVGGPALTIYQPVLQMGYAARMFVRAAGDPHALEPAIRKTIREIAPNQPVEHPATLEEIRADVLSPERLNAVVLTGFAGVALLIAAVGVAGVLAFSVSARMHEFGVRLAIGLAPRQLLMLVLREGVLIVMIGILAGTAAGYAFAGVAARYVESIQPPGALPLVAAAVVLVGAAVAASLMPAARAARVDVLQALRTE
jgi:putative ABC transport system permease protein